ncbi:hypothetical protein NXG27_12160 [Megasphaera paucivorans]|nr:hypothetical protein [Megasphaera paucivorans]
MNKKIFAATAMLVVLGTTSVLAASKCRRTAGPISRSKNYRKQV